MSNPLITIVVPVYKVEKYLEECIESILNQTYENLEIILVDDGSPDNCGKICDEYANKDNRINVIHKENGGLSDARNAGIDIASGEYITFVDSDDFIFKDHIQKLINLTIRESADFAMCGCIHCKENDTLETVKNDLPGVNAEYNFIGEDKFKAFYVDNIVDTVAWKKLYKIELFSNLRFPKGKLNEDAFVILQLLDIAKKVCVTTYKGYAYRINSESIMHSEFSSKKLDSIEAKIFQNNYIEKHHPQFTSYSRAGIVYACNYCLRSMALSKYNDKIILQKLKKLYKKYYRDYIKQNNVSFLGKVIAIIAKLNIGLAYAILGVVR